MPNPQIITSILGAITGIAALVFSYVNHRRLQKIKALDLRIELRKQVAEVRAMIDGLPELLERARKSRDAVLAALGTLLTGYHQQVWKPACASDIETAKKLAVGVPAADETFQRASHQELEEKLLEIHALGLKAKQLRDKYLAELASDDRDREHIRARALAHVPRPS